MAAFELYSVDAQLQHSSKCLLDYFPTKKKAIKFAKKDSSKGRLQRYPGRFS